MEVRERERERFLDFASSPSSRGGHDAIPSDHVHRWVT